MTFLRRYGRFLLLAFVPIAVGLELTMPENHTAIFCASVVAILPLAAMIGRATDVLADPGSRATCGYVRRDELAWPSVGAWDVGPSHVAQHVARRHVARRPSPVAQHVARRTCSHVALLHVAHST